MERRKFLRIGVAVTVITSFVFLAPVHFVSPQVDGCSVCHLDQWKSLSCTFVGLGVMYVGSFHVGPPGFVGTAGGDGGLLAGCVPQFEVNVTQP